jgi:NAD(P) transhydrogenase subunit alpha
MYARNISTFLLYMMKEGKLELNLQDEIVRETMVTRGGEVVNARVREFFKMPGLVAK